MSAGIDHSYCRRKKDCSLKATLSRSDKPLDVMHMSTGSDPSYCRRKVECDLKAALLSVNKPLEDIRDDDDDEIVIVEPSRPLQTRNRKDAACTSPAKTVCGEGAGAGGGADVGPKIVIIVKSRDNKVLKFKVRFVCPSSVCACTSSEARLGAAC